MLHMVLHMMIAGAALLPAVHQLNTCPSMSSVLQSIARSVSAERELCMHATGHPAAD